MAISRPFLLALLGAVLLFATFFAVQSSRNSSGDDAAPAAQQVQPAEQAAAPAAPAEPAPAEPAKLTAEEALKAITSPGTRVTAGRFNFEYDGREVGGGREHDHLELSGSFECGCKADVPKFDLTYNSHNENGYRDRGKNESFRAVSTGDEGFVGEAGGDTLYRVDPEGLANVAKLRAAVAGGAISAVPDFDVSRWVPNARVVGTEEMDGVETTHVRGDLSARGVGTDIVRLLKSDAERSQVDVPPGVVRTADRVVKRAQAVVHPQPDLAALDQTSPFQVSEMARGGRLRNPEGRVDVAHAHLARSEERQDAHSRGIRQSLEHIRQRSGRLLHIRLDEYTMAILYSLCRI